MARAFRFSARCLGRARLPHGAWPASPPTTSKDFTHIAIAASALLFNNIH